MGRYIKRLFLLSVLAPTVLFAQTVIRDTTFVEIHKKTLLISCAVAACHDGTFEPDFRTVQSSYATLVYHPVIKNNAAGTFKYRVVPYDTAKSVLHERITNCCFVNENDRMPFTVGITLKQEEIDRISNWINKGAKDINGVTYKALASPPIIGILLRAFKNDTIEISKEEYRKNKEGYQPILIPSAMKEMKLMVYAAEDVDAGSNNIKVEVFLSDNKLDFTSGIKFTTKYKGDGQFVAVLPLKRLEKNKVYYVNARAYNTKNNTQTVFPVKSSHAMLRNLWSFMRQ
jgi:hypothetical protein